MGDVFRSEFMDILYTDYPWWYEEVHAFLLCTHDISVDEWQYIDVVPRYPKDVDYSTVFVPVQSVNDAARFLLFEPTVIAAAKVGHLGLIQSFISAWYSTHIQNQELPTGQNPWLFAAYVSARRGHHSLVQACLDALVQKGGLFYFVRPDLDMHYAYHVWKFMTNCSLSQLDGDGSFQHEECLHRFFSPAYEHDDVKTLMVHLAAIHGDTQCVARLLCPDPSRANAPQELGFTPLHLAACNGHESTVSRLLEIEGIHVDSRDEILGRVALHYACENGHLVIVRMLVMRSAPEHIDAVDYNGVTPLHLAAARGHKEVVQLLLSSRKCDVSRRVRRSLLRYRHCALYQPSRSGSGDSWFQNELNGRRVSLLLPSYLPLPALGVEGFTALHLAVAYSEVETARAILESARQSCNDGMTVVDFVNAQDSNGMTALDWAKAAGHGDLMQLPISSYAADSLTTSTLPTSTQSRPPDAYGPIASTSSATTQTPQPDINDSQVNSSNTAPMVMSKAVSARTRALYLQMTREREKGNYIQHMHSVIVAVARGELDTALALAQTAPKLEAEDDVLDEEEDEPRGVEMQAWRRLRVELDDLELEVPCYSRVPTQDVVLALVKRQVFCSRFSREKPGLIAQMESRGDVRRHMYEERQVYVDYGNTLLVGAVLIAGLAYQVWLQPPRGFAGD
ncbi:hypothetical protein GOP47_0021086, partial [Adiantum capillus-veneris]